MKTKTQMQFVVDDGGECNPNDIPTWAKRAIEAIKKLPDGKLLTMRALASKLESQLHNARFHTTHPVFETLKFKPRANLVYFGNPKTIAAARKQYS